MYGIFTYIYPKSQLNVRKYTISMDGMGYDWMPRDVSPLIYSKKRRCDFWNAGARNHRLDGDPSPKTGPPSLWVFVGTS